MSASVAALPSTNPALVSVSSVLVSKLLVVSLASAMAELAAAMALLITIWSKGLPETTPVTALVTNFF